MTEPSYRTFFRGDYQRAWRSTLARADTAAEVQSLIDQLGLAPGQSVLDTVCGHGRHAVPLAAHGFRVTGADLSEQEIAAAREAASLAQVDAHFVVSDMRELPFSGEFDAAYNFYTSFGFLESEEEDLRALRAFHGALRTGGRFLIDRMNPAAIVRGFQPQGWEVLEGGAVVLRQREIDFRRGAIIERVEMHEPGGAMSGEYELHIRLYPPDQLCRALESAGFRIVELCGGMDGARFAVDSARLVIMAEAM